MFPHTMTIYHHSIVSNVDNYTMYTISGVYWNESNGITNSGHGNTNSKTVTVITSKATTDTFGDSWNIEAGDRIIKGTGGAISKFADLNNPFTVRDITINECGCPLDNIVILGA